MIGGSIRARKASGRAKQSADRDGLQRQAPNLSQARGSSLRATGKVSLRGDATAPKGKTILSFVFA